MPMIDMDRSCLVVIDFQSRLMPVIHDAETILRNASRLLQAAEMLAVPRVFTEQNPARLGSTVDGVPVGDAVLVHKQCFGACGEAGFLNHIPQSAQIIVTGCETHVCVLQTVLGLLEAGRQIHVVQDAVGSRHPDNKLAALRRMERHGADIVTTEMVIFEWLKTAEHPRFREVSALIK